MFSVESRTTRRSRRSGSFSTFLSLRLFYLSAPGPKRPVLWKSDPCFVVAPCSRTLFSLLLMRLLSSGGSFVQWKSRLWPALLCQVSVCLGLQTNASRLCLNWSRCFGLSVFRTVFFFGFFTFFLERSFISSGLIPLARAELHLEPAGL